MTANFIIPPYLIENLRRTAATDAAREAYRQTLEHDHVLRARRAQRAPGVAAAEGDRAAPGPDRLVYDAGNGTDLPGREVRREGDGPANDSAVDEAYDGTGATWRMFKECFGRDSVDDQGLRLTSTVHYDRDYNNAFWNGEQMVYGDGDGEVFTRFTGIDITGHELTHGVTQHTVALEYQGQSGALNESVSDVFGSLTKQYALGQTAEEADWIIGEGIFQPGVNGAGLRSMKEPGTAYDDPRLGKDPQPSSMDSYVETEEDNGGVHINSGIPNRAFYLTATKIGGHSWEGAGQIWYDAITSGKLSPRADFARFAQATIECAQERFGKDSAEVVAVTRAWQEVGVEPAAKVPDGQDVSKFLGDRSPHEAGQAVPATAGDGQRPAAVRAPDRGAGRGAGR
ncbi:MAG TPA: M4 family metallopeptidase [Nocardioides sp.]